MRRHESGKGRIEYRAIRRFMATLSTGTLLDRMKHTKTDAVFPKAGYCFAGEIKSHRAANSNDNFPIPPESDVWGCTIHLKHDAKSIVRFFDVQVVNARWHRPPIAIANHAVDRADDL